MGREAGKQHDGARARCGDGFMLADEAAEGFGEHLELAEHSTYRRPGNVLRTRLAGDRDALPERLARAGESSGGEPCGEPIDHAETRHG